MSFFLLLRRSKNLSDTSKVTDFIIQQQDITFLTSDGRRARTVDEVEAAQIIFRGCKTDQFKLRETRIIEQSGSNWLCSLLVTWSLVNHGRIQKIPHDPPARSVRPGRVIKTAEIAHVIKSVATASGVDPSRHSTHSMRSGGSAAIFAAGVD